MSATSVGPISMTSFGQFCAAADPLGQLSKVREIRRRYEQDYTPGGDFWSRWREAVEDIHARDGGREELAGLGQRAQANRGPQYVSASAGYEAFWGRKRIELVGSPKPAIWVHDRLRVRVNPEWLLRVNGKLVIVKLHLTERLPLNQRLANPLLHLLQIHFSSSDQTVGILDVHRGKLWRPTAASRAMDDVLRMQAAAFLVGWDASERTAA